MFRTHPFSTYAKFLEKLIFLTPRYAHVIFSFSENFGRVLNGLSRMYPLREKCLNTYFLVFGLNMGKYGPEKTPYLDTFHAVIGIVGRH